MKIIDVEQGSPEWFKVKAGIPSASAFDMIITSDGKPSKQREKYMYSLAGEKISGVSEDGFKSFAMEKGLEKETEARDYYAMLHDKDTVIKAGFCLSDNGLWGCSPDSFVNDIGGLELKCPLIHTHVAYLLHKDKFISDYFQQVQGSLFVTGYKWWDLMSYYPGLKPLIIKVEPDKKFLKALEVELTLFCEELEEITKKIK